MVGFIVPSSSLNSFGSISYCICVIVIHSYACFKDITRYKEASDRAWPSNGGEPPGEVSLLLALVVISLLVMPFFIIASFIKVGNLASDGVKLGRDQDSKPADCDTSASVKDNKDKKDKKDESTSFGVLIKRKARYLWKHFCPIAQMLHLFAAFLLLLPEVLLTAEEIKSGYKSADLSWQSELDFLFSSERPTLSHIKSSVNLSTHPNATNFDLSKTLSASKGWGDRITISIAFVHFCIALVCFLVRYASVFWYTNKALTLTFAFQLLSMVVNSIFGFNSFATLYCVCHNQKLFRNVHLSIDCGVGLALYLISGAILLLSTITLFEYGSHYFHEKSKIIERNHVTDTFMKRTVIVNSGCQGFIPHSCAMGALVLFGICKAPLIFDMVHLMRVTSDQLLLVAVICEVCYMVTWVTLWFGLTIKQKWRFRILDYVTLRHAKSMPLAGSFSQVSSKGQGDTIDSRIKRHSSGSSVPIRSIDSANGTVTSNTYGDQQCPSDLGTDESDQVNMATTEIRRGSEGRLVGDFSSLKRSRGKRNTGVRVKFHDSSTRLSANNVEDDTPMFGSLTRRSSFHRERSPVVEHTGQVDVQADIHTIAHSTDALQHPSHHALVRRYSDHREHPSTLPKDYRNSLRSKCGEYYAPESTSHSTVGDIDSATNIPPMEPLPTLMSSFRDRVRESSLAASNFKERERNMFEHYHTYDEHIAHHPTTENNIDSCEQIDPSTMTNHINHANNSIDQNSAGEYIQQNHAHSYQNHHHNQRPNHQQHTPNKTSSYVSMNNHQTIIPNHESPSTQPSTPANSTFESSDSGLSPPAEDKNISRMKLRPQEDKLVGDNKGIYNKHPFHAHHQVLQNHFKTKHQLPPPHPRPLKVMLDNKKGEIGRRDSANFSLTSSQDTSSNESDNGHGLCSQV